MKERYKTFIRKHCTERIILYCKQIIDTLHSSGVVTLRTLVFSYAELSKTKPSKTAFVRSLRIGTECNVYTVMRIYCKKHCFTVFLTKLCFGRKNTVCSKEYIYIYMYYISSENIYILYIFWERTASPPPIVLNWDASPRLLCRQLYRQTGT